MQMAHALSLLKLAVIALVLLGMDPFRYLGTHTPAPFVWMLNNKLYSCLMLFFVCGAIESRLVSTGAFEIYFNDVRVWSKIETGRIPSPPELFQIIDNQVFLKSSVLSLADR
ncbi:thioredoxin reductase-like selenoprotein T homolog CG3887 [Ixodes scapularis]